MLCAPTLTPASTLPSTNELFKWFIKVYLEAQTQLTQPTQPAQPEFWEKSLKARFPDFY